MNDKTTEHAEHHPAQSFDWENKWVTVCSCGERFTASTPSAAYTSCEKHVAKSGNKTESRPTPVPARAKVCGCGCGEPLAARANGLFRSGHDARFKSVLTAAHAESRLVPHPLTRAETAALDVARWLDERRGGGSFWSDKVLAGHKPQPVRKPRPIKNESDVTARAVARVDAIMEFQATRRPAPGDIGVVTLRSGMSHGAQVLQRVTEDSVQLRLLDGSARGEKIITGDHRFKRGGR